VPAAVKLPMEMPVVLPGSGFFSSTRTSAPDSAADRAAAALEKQAADSAELRIKLVHGHAWVIGGDLVAASG